MIKVAQGNVTEKMTATGTIDVNETADIFGILGALDTAPDLHQDPSLDLGRSTD